MSAIQLAAIWEGLISGSCKVKSWSHTEKTWSLIVSSRLSRASVPPSRDLDIFKHALLCGVTAQVAARANLSTSSISMIQQKCLRFMGLSCTPSRMPGLVFAAAHAHHRLRHANRLSFPSKHAKITIPRPDLALAAHLTGAEFEVVKLLVEGRSYAEIALERDTSFRTVANQIQLSFRRLGVSGRLDLLCNLAYTWVREQSL